MALTIIDFLKRHQFRFIFIGALLIYCYTALMSHGYFHADEHYQIIEFAHNKLNNLPSHLLPWEYQEAIRPTLQVNIAYFFLWLFSLIDLVDPISQMTIIRFITALSSVLVIRFFVEQSKKQFHLKYHLAYQLCSYFLWFFPLLASRFSSENLSSLLLLSSLGYFFKGKTKNTNFLLLGVLFGFSFLFRFQIAFVLLGFGIWLILVKRIRVSNFFRFGLGFLATLLFGVINDCWFYEQLTFTPWNYFNKAIIDPFVFNFGSSPWYYYMTSIFQYGTTLIAVLFFLSLIVLVIKKPKSLSLFIFIPFIFLHSYFEHKEIRFLFPIAFLLPFLMFEALEQISKFINFNSKILSIFLLSVFILLNGFGIGVNSQKAAGDAKVEMIRYINKTYTEQAVQIYYAKWSNPYDPWQGLPAHFYTPENLDFKLIENVCDLEQEKFDSNKVNLFILRQIDFESSICTEQLNKWGFEYQKQSLSEQVKKITDQYTGFNNDLNLILFTRN